MTDSRNRGFKQITLRAAMADTAMFSAACGLVCLLVRPTPRDYRWLYILYLGVALIVGRLAGCKRAGLIGGSMGLVIGVIAAILNHGARDQPQALLLTVILSSIAGMIVHGLVFAGVALVQHGGLTGTAKATRTDSGD